MFAISFSQFKRYSRIKSNSLIGLFAASLALLSWADPSQAITILDFSFNPAFAPGDPIPQSYGDIAGQLDLSYSSVVSPGSQVPCFDSGVYFWDTNYSNLTDVAYGCNGGTTQVKLTPAPGHLVTLHGFDLGAWSQVDRPSQVAIYLDNTSNLIFEDPAPLTISGSMAKTYEFTGYQFTSQYAFVIQFGPDGHNVGIDNLGFSVEPVPVPGPLPVFSLVAALGFSRVMRQRIRAVRQ